MGERLATHDLRTIALYLPQYHPIPENDLWWGKGFTEWTNITKTEPNYVGHNQPRFPADLGYYDLRVPEVLEQQAELARRTAFPASAIITIGSTARRLLDHPLERMLETGKPDFPFCLAGRMRIGRDAGTDRRMISCSASLIRKTRHSTSSRISSATFA